MFRKLIKEKLGIFIFCAAIFTVPQIALAESELESPYFIDEIHCSGLSDIGSGALWFVPKEGKEAITKVLQRDRCEAIFSHFGLNRFEWLTKDDLETLELKVKESKQFLNVKISIKKSDLKNHIHLFAEFTPFSDYHFSISNSFSIYGKDNATGGGYPRIRDKFDFLLTSRSEVPAFSKIGLSVDTSQAKNSSYVLSSKQEDVGSNTVSTSTPVPTKHTFADLYFGFLGPINIKNLDTDMSVHFFIHNEESKSDFPLFYEKSPDKPHSYASSMINWDLLYNSTPMWMSGKNYIGPSFKLVFLGTPEKSKENGLSSLFFPGIKAGYFYGKTNANHLKFNLEYFSSAKDNHTIYDMNVHFQKVLESAGNLLVGVGCDQEIIKNAILPYHRYFLNDYDDMKLYGDIGKNVFSGESIHQLHLNVGLENINTINDSHDSSTPFVGLTYSTSTENYLVNLGLQWASKRIY